jgi:3-oxoadipate enol-lactonase
MVACEVRHLVQGPVGAPPLVFLNSLGSDLAMWDPQAAALERDFRVVRYDARGHGASPVPPGPYSVADLGGDLLALLDRLGIERASLCGTSLGGATAIWFAAHAPERVDRLVVCCSSAFFGAASTYMERAALVRAEGAEAVADAVARRWFTAAMFEARPVEASRMRAMIAATPAEGYAASAEAVAAVDLRASLASVVAPTIVIAAAEDRATPPEHGRRIAAGIVGADFAEVPRAAHLPSFERPETVDELIRAHLDRPAAEAAR